jgi:hypothetical protein
MEAEGIEPSSTGQKCLEKQGFSVDGGAQSGAEDADLRFLLDAWSRLAPSDRVSVLALVRSRIAGSAGADVRAGLNRGLPQHHSAAGGNTSCRASGGRDLGPGPLASAPERSDVEQSKEESKP